MGVPGQAFASVTRLSFATLGLAGMLMACGPILPAPSIAEPPAQCNFPDEVRLSFGGTASLSEVGLSPAGGTADTPAELYVTAEPITIPAMGSNDPHRRFCIVYADDAPITQMDGLVPDDWAPPNAP